MSANSNSPADGREELEHAKSTELLRRAAMQTSAAIFAAKRKTEEELERARLELANAYTWQKTMLDSASVAIVATNSEGLIQLFNRAAEKLLGYSPDELIGKQTPLCFHLPEELKERAAELTVELGRSISPDFEVFAVETNAIESNEREWTFVGKAGKRIPVRLIVNAMLDPAGRTTGYLGIATDLSERKRSDERLRTVIEVSPNGILMADEGGRITLVNSQTEKLFGYTRSELIGQPIEILVPMPLRGAHPSHRKGYLVDPKPRAMGTGRDLFGRRKDGTEVPIEIGLSPVVASTGTYILASIIDITERKKAESLLRAKNETLKAFAYTVSHDLKAPLRGIVGYAQELERRHSAQLTERPQYCVSQIISAAKSLDRMIDDLLNYARLDAESPTTQAVQLREMVESVLNEHQVTLTDTNCRLTLDVPSVQIVVWERGLRQIIANLISNALKFSRNSKPPIITLSVELTASKLLLRVKDNGIGFDQRYHDRIFGLFDRLVRAGDFEGTGAGLAIVKKITTQLGGTVRAESTVDHGALFVVDIPLNSEPTAR